MLDAAFEALKTFDWGIDLAVLGPIEDAVIASHDRPDARRDLENRLIAALNEKLSRDAQDYVCRKLATVGSAASIPSLSVLLVKPENSHMARFALERISGFEAGEALRGALDYVNGNVKIGVISSLGARREAASIPPLGKLLKDNDPAIVRSASIALGIIGTIEAAVLLQAAVQSATGNRPQLVDALLSCAEALLGSNKPSDATSIYKTLMSADHQRLVRLAATRGLLACASKQA